MTVINSNNNVEISLVMPCLNEEKTIGLCINEIHSFFENTNIKYEIIIGNNNSSDNSKKIALNLGAKVVDVSEPGYGITLIKATLASEGKYIIMGDSDLSYDFSNLMPFINELRNGSKLVMGNRFLGGIEKGAMPWKNKYIGNPILSKIGQIFFTTTINDFHCGLRGFSKESFKKWNLQSTGMEFASEMVIKATLLKDKVTEVPTILRRDGREGRSHLRPWRDGLRHLSFMLIHSPRWMFLYPGFLLLLIFGFLFILLSISNVKVMGIHLQTNSLISSAFILSIGLQIFMFGIISEIYSYKVLNLPIRNKLASFLNDFGLKFGLIISSLFILIGSVLFFLCLRLWYLNSFGDLVPNLVQKPIIFSCTLLLLGVQMSFNSFFICYINYRNSKVDL